MKPTPECMAALQRHDHLADTLGEDHPDTRAAMMLVMELAPPELQTMMRDKAIEMGLIPPASGYLEDGTPAYRLEDVATRLGLFESEAQASLAQFMAERAAAGLDTMLINPALVHRTQ